MGIKDLIIAIDGYSSTGKSSFAKMVAVRYGLKYLDSGALYRAVTLFAMENSLITDGVLDNASLRSFLGDLHIHFKFAPDGRSRTFIGGRDVEDEIRSMDVAGNVSLVAADPFVRNFVDNILHSYGRSGGVIMDGRDIGTTVFPNADLKIFMTAQPGTRALRRMNEMKAQGKDCSMEEVLENLRQRDWADSHRKTSPLKQAPDAVVLDNTDMTFEDQMEWISNIIRTRFPQSDES